MNILKTISKAAKALIKTLKELLGMVKASLQIKRAKVRVWHEYQKLMNSDYVEGIFSIITGLVKIIVPLQVIATVISALIDNWQDAK